MKYRTIPHLVEAAQWHKNGDHPQDAVMRHYEDTGVVPNFPREGAVVRYFRLPSIDGGAVCKICKHTMREHGWIDTAENGHTVCPGDWIITGVFGEHYPCKPSIFACLYESA